MLCALKYYLVPDLGSLGGHQIMKTRLFKYIENFTGKNWKFSDKTGGPWWSYIAHLTKQICIFTVEVSAKFTALGFLYKLYSTNHPHPPPPHPRPCFFTNLDDLNWILKDGHQRNISAKLYWKLVQWFKKFYIAIKPYALMAMFFDESWQLEQTWNKKEHSCQVILKSVRCSDKKIFKVFYLDI